MWLVAQSRRGDLGQHRLSQGALVKSGHQSACWSSGSWRVERPERISGIFLEGGGSIWRVLSPWVVKSEKLETVAMSLSGAALGAAASNWAALPGKLRRLCVATSGPGRTPAPVQNPVFPSSSCLPTEPRAHLSDPSPHQLRDTCHR